VLVAASDPRALWYATRGFGLVDLVLLTLTVALGVAQVARYTRPGWPRFLISGLHRNVSLLAVVLLGVHIATAVADPYAPIGVVDVFVPFVSRYRPVWLGLGALASDLVVALVVTSLVRDRMGQRTWRAIHWCAYGCWPVALVHSLGTGTDSRLGWVQLLYVGCAAIVLAAIAWRLTSRWTAAAPAYRVGAATVALVAVAGVGAWSAQGPLKAGWARRAGTPATLLHPSGKTNKRAPDATTHLSHGSTTPAARPRP
jgi:predicted ferric reductase